MHNNFIGGLRSSRSDGIALRYATIAGRADQWFFLRDAAPESIERATRALRADSCLIEPDCGDTVLVCAGDGMGAASYILALLKRADKHAATVVFPGSVAISASHGQLSFIADRVELSGRDSLALQAPKIDVAAIKGEMKFCALNVSAQQIDARFGTVTTLARSVHTSVGRLVQKAKNSFRWIENLDETRARRMRLQVQDRYNLQTKHASVIADGLVKIDGEKIDLG